MIKSLLPACAGCGTVLTPSFFNTGVRRCPACEQRLRADVFPAFFTPVGIGAAGPVLVEGESGCFYHPQKKAVEHCDTCGRFLCQLCDIELGGKHLCPQCIQAGKKKGKIKDLENHRVLYDGIALSLAIIPGILFWFTIVTAPIVIYMTIKHWRSPSSILPRTKIRFVTAFILAAMEITGWAVFIGAMIKKM